MFSGGPRGGRQRNHCAQAICSVLEPTSHHRTRHPLDCALVLSRGDQRSLGRKRGRICYRCHQPTVAARAARPLHVRLVCARGVSRCRMRDAVVLRASGGDASAHACPAKPILCFGKSTFCGTADVCRTNLWSCHRHPNGVGPLTLVSYSPNEGMTSYELKENHAEGDRPKNWRNCSNSLCRSDRCWRGFSRRAGWCRALRWESPHRG